VSKRIIIMYERGMCKLGMSNERNPAPWTAGATTRIITGRFRNYGFSQFVSEAIALLLMALKERP